MKTLEYYSQLGSSRTFASCGQDVSSSGRACNPFYSMAGHLKERQAICAPRKLVQLLPVSRRLFLRQHPGICQNVNRVLQVKCPQVNHFDTWMTVADFVQDLPRVRVCFGSDIPGLVSIAPIE